MNSFSKESLPRRPRLLSLSLQSLGLNLDISLHLQCSFPSLSCNGTRHLRPVSSVPTGLFPYDDSALLRSLRWVGWGGGVGGVGIPKSPDSPKKFMDLLAGGMKPGGPSAMPALLPRAGRRIGLPGWQPGWEDLGILGRPLSLFCQLLWRPRQQCSVLPLSQHDSELLWWHLTQSFCKWFLMILCVRFSSENASCTWSSGKELATAEIANAIWDNLM